MCCNNSVTNRFMEFKRKTGEFGARLLFLMASIVCVLFVGSTVKGIQYCYLFIPFPLFLIEAIVTVTIVKKFSSEWKWITPSIVAYLLCTLPSIWLMELNDFKNMNQTYHGCEEINGNVTWLKTSLTSNITHLSIGIERFRQCTPKCTSLMEQIVLLVVILGRWMLPMADDMSRGDAVEILLMAVAIAGDTLEFMDIKSSDFIKPNFTLTVAVLIIWTVSLVQFPLVPTANGPPCGCNCFETPLWPRITFLLLQDVPFLGMRLYFMIYYEVVNHVTVFFAVKNALVLIFNIKKIRSFSVIWYTQRQRMMRSKVTLMI